MTLEISALLPIPAAPQIIRLSRLRIACRRRRVSASRSTKQRVLAVPLIGSVWSRFAACRCDIAKNLDVPAAFPRNAHFTTKTEQDEVLVKFCEVPTQIRPNARLWPMKPTTSRSY